MEQRPEMHLHTTRTLQAKLGQAAEASGRSLEQEVEVRLELSFRDNEMRQIVREEMATALFLRGASLEECMAFAITH